jgi:C-terminal processing protease CtpA/Prc
LNVLNAMLNELKDGHVSLIAPFNAASNRSWYFNYPPNYNANIIDRNYLGENRRIILPFSTQWLADSSVAYIRYSSFSNGVSGESMNELYKYYGRAKGWIIDIRDNTGGSLANVDAIMNRFVDAETKVGAVQYKVGPARQDFSKFFPYLIKPSEKGNKYFGKVIVLTNRRVYSAANFFSSAMSTLNNVTILGDQTGGGGGAPYSGQLLNGWAYTFSTTLLLTPDNQQIENGILPDVKVDLAPADEAKGVDTILERALALLR